MRRRKPRQLADPLATMPAELATFDAREWAAPGEEPDEHGFDTGNIAGGWDHDRALKRYWVAVRGWFDAHPEADCIEWIHRTGGRSGKDGRRV